MRESSAAASRTFAYASSRRRKSSTSPCSSSESARSGRSDFDLISRSVAAIWMKKAVSSTGKTSCERTCSTKSFVIEARARSFTKSFLASMRSSTTSSGPSYASVLLLKSSGIAFYLGIVQEEVDAVDVAREQGRLLHIAESAHLLCQSLETHAPAAVRRDAVFECLEVERELVGVKTFHPRAFDEILIVVPALSARRYLDAAEEEIEALRVARVLRILHRVERALGDRIVRDEDEVAVVLAPRPFAEPTLVLWVEVRLRATVFAGLLEYKLL